MAGADRMAIEEVVRKVLVDEHADVLRESVRWLVGQLMEVEVVRHEALSDRAGCETSPPGCRSSLVKLGAVRTRSCGRGREQPRQRRAVRAPSDRAGLASKAERCNKVNR
jgi:hypothetical protein